MAKKVHHIKWADGKIHTIVDIEPDVQTGDVTLFLRKHMGMELFLIMGLLIPGMLLGYLTFKIEGVIIGALGTGIAGVLLVSQTSIGEITERTVPQSAIIGFDNYFQLKSKSYCFCCHSFDSMGNSVSSEMDPIAMMEDRLRAKDQFIKNLKGRISTLNYQVQEAQMSRKELADTVSAELKKILESTVTPTKARPYVYPHEALPPESFMMSSREGEEEE